MAVTITQKDPGPHPTTPIAINPPAFNASDSRSAQDRVVDQQWRDAARDRLGDTHPGSINPDTSYA